MELRNLTKRTTDLVVSFCGLLIFAIPMMIIALLIRATMGTPVFFCQMRPGIYGKPFMMYKFRTMYPLKDENGKLLPDIKRISCIGRFLRRTSLDELPGLFNVLRGDMSLVGPRPLLMDYLKLYTIEQARRMKVKPGITGWAQINGRNAITWEDRFKMDLWYVDNYSFWLDMKIIFLTMLKVVKMEGINQSSSVTMEEFRGSET